MRIRRRPRSPSLLSSCFSDECSSHCERTVSHRQRKCCEAPRRRSKHHLRALPGIELGIVANAFKNVFFALRCLYPGRDRASGVGTNRRIRNDAVSRARARVVIKFGRIKLDEYHLVQPRPFADHRSLGVLRPCTHRRSARLQILRLDHFALAIALGENQEVGLLRSQVAARGVLLGSGGSRRRRVHRSCEGGQDDRAACLI